MLEIHKSYVIDENPQPIAVKIPLEQFYKIEEILENYGLPKLIKQTEGDERLSKDQALNGTYPLRGSPEESGRIRAIGLATLRGSLV
jgi:hypothetical protein